MIYLRPIPDRIHSKNNTLVVTKSVDYSIKDNTNGKTIIIQIQIVEMNTGLDKDGYMTGKAIGKIPNEYIETIHRHIELKSKCSYYGETLNQKLLNFLISYYPESKTSLLEKDFMKLRDELSEIIKTDTFFYKIERLNTPKSRKTFRKQFAEFIEDRNIYTHGSIVYRTNDNKILINYIDKPNKKYSYSEINFEIMNSYEELFQLLSKILAELRKHVGEKREIDRKNNSLSK